MAGRTGGANAGGVQSLERAFHMLELLADAGGVLSLSELAVASGLPMPTIHRLVRTLVAQGYVRQEASRRYTLGPRLIRLGETASRLLGTWAQPYLYELMESTGESANMALLDAGEVVYVAHVPGRHTIRMFTEVGRRLQPHCTAVGKVLLAQLPDARAEELLRGMSMTRHTAHTITDPVTLLGQLPAVREQGYAVDDGEQELGVRCVAVPVLGSPAMTAISVSGPEARIRELQEQELVARMKRIAAELGKALESSAE